MILVFGEEEKGSGQVFPLKRLGIWWESITRFVLGQEVSGLLKLRRNLYLWLGYQFVIACQHWIELRNGTRVSILPVFSAKGVLNREITYSLSVHTLCNSLTNSWSEIMEILADLTRHKKSLFCIRSAFQAVLYAV